MRNQNLQQTQLLGMRAEGSTRMHKQIPSHQRLSRKNNQLKDSHICEVDLPRIGAHAVSF